MADYPCDYHLDRYSGESTRMFINLYRNEDTAALRMSVCGDCLAEITSAFIERALYKNDRGFWTIPRPDEPSELRWQPRTQAVQPLNGSKRF